MMIQDDLGTGTLKPPTEDSKRLQTLYSVSAMLNQLTVGMGTGQILPKVIRACLDYLEADFGSIFVLNDDNILEHAIMIQGDQIFTDTNWPVLRQILTKGLAGQVLHSGEPIRINDSLSDPRWYNINSTDSINDLAQSAVCVPLFAQNNRVTGTITVTKHGTNQFDDDDLSLLRAIAEHGASAILNARLYEQSIEQTNILAELVHASTTVASSLEGDRIIRDVAEYITKLLHVEATAILEWLPHRETLIGRSLYVSANGGSHLPKQDRLRLDSSPLIEDLLRNPRPIQVNTQSINPDPDAARLLKRLGLQSMMIIPISAQTQVIGLALIMVRKQIRVFNEQHISIAQTLGTQAAVAVQNARLYEEAQRQLRLMHLLNEAGKMINSSLDLDQIMQALLAQMNGFLHVEALSIALVDSERNELVYTVAEGVGSEKIIGMRLPSNYGVSGWVMETGNPAIVNDTQNDKRFTQAGDERTGHPTRAIIVAPLQVKGYVLGTIQAINPIERTIFSEGDLQVLVNLANLASSAIANAQQHIRTQQAESRYISLFQDSVSPIMLTDIRGQVVEVNSRACELFGYERAELLKLNVNQIHSVKTGLLGETQFEPIRTQQVKVFTSKLRTHDNREVMAEVYAKRLLIDDDQGDRQMLQWIYHDISEQVELQEMREDLTAMLFHDLQSPLGNVISSLELVVDDLHDDTSDPTRNMLDVAMKSSQRLQRLIKSLLDINRLESGQPIENRQFTNIREMIEEARDSIQASLERRNIRFVQNMPVFIPDVFIDDDMMSRVIINLLDNALKYSSDGHTITVVVDELVAGEGITISIQDQGPGIPEEYRESIFDKFRRIKDGLGRKGLGLGLAFCRLAVEAHQGRIWVDSAEEGGARFSIYLPIMAE